MSSKRNTHARNEILDVIRGLAILIVILGHALQGTNHGETGGTLHAFILSFQMELMFAISGFSAVYARKGTFRLALERHLLRLGVPYFVWVGLAFLFQAVRGIAPWAPSQIANLVMTSGFWFLRQLLLIYIAYEVYARFKPAIGIALGLCTLSAFACIPGQETLLHYALWFAIGYAAHLIGRRILPSLALANPLPRRPSSWLVWCGRNSLALYAVYWNIFFSSLSMHVNFHTLVERGLGFYTVALLLFVLFTAGSVFIILVMKNFLVLPQLFFGEPFTRRPDQPPA